MVESSSLLSPGATVARFYSMLIMCVVFQRSYLPLPLAVDCFVLTHGGHHIFICNTFVCLLPLSECGVALPACLFMNTMCNYIFCFLLEFFPFVHLLIVKRNKQ